MRKQVKSNEDKSGHEFAKKKLEAERKRRKREREGTWLMKNPTHINDCPYDESSY